MINRLKSALFALLSSLVLAAPAFAAPGNEDHGGGDAVCSRVTDTCQLVDYVQAYRLGSFTRAELEEGLGGDAAEDPARKVQRVIKRIRRLDPALADKMQIVIDRIASSTSDHLPVSRPTSTESALGFTLAPGESLKRAAEWHFVDESGDATDSRITWYWNHAVEAKMDNFDRAGLILHEAVYLVHRLDRDVNGRPWFDLNAVRETTAWFSNKWLDTATAAELDQFLYEEIDLIGDGWRSDRNPEWQRSGASGVDPNGEH
jgi:hypothetical protein